MMRIVLYLIFSVPARVPDPTWVELDGEETDTNDRWDPKFGRNASFNRTLGISVEIC